MPKVESSANSIRQAKPVEADQGGELVDSCDEYLAPSPFSCRSASCGTCHVAVLEGHELIEPPNDAEEELLRVLGGDGSTRLACQAVIKPGPGLIRLRSML